MFQIGLDDGDFDLAPFFQVSALGPPNTSIPKANTSLVNLSSCMSALLLVPPKPNEDTPQHMASATAARAWGVFFFVRGGLAP